MILLENKVIFFKTFSDESDKAEEILKENKIDFIPIIQNSYDSPKLYSASSIAPYEGITEILEYLETK